MTIDMNPNIIGYFPNHIKRMEEFEGIAKTYDKMLKLVWDAESATNDNRHFDTMDTDTCSYWEKLMSLTPTSEDTLDDRRRAVKAGWMSNAPYTDKKLKAILATMLTQEGYELVIDKTGKKVSVGVKLAYILKYDYIADLIRRLIPADMISDVYIAFNRWQRFKTVTWGSLTTETWSGMRNDRKWQEVST